MTPTTARPVEHSSRAVIEAHGLEAIHHQLNACSLLDAAVAYAELGIPVFPLEENGKRPHRELPDRGPGSGGLHLAHRDTHRIEAWWRNYPDSNIGLRCGDAFDVLDIDTKNDAPGWDSTRKLNTRGLLAGAFAHVRTPSGGGHLYFAPSGDGNHQAGSTRSGLDSRGVGGYVVAPPSIIDGSRYQWAGVLPDRYGPVLSWQSVLDTLAPKRPSVPAARQATPGRLEHLERFVLELTPGNRNAGLHWAGCRAAADGLDPLELLPAALSIGLDEWEATSTLRSAARNGASS